MSNERELGIMDIFINPMKVTVKQFLKSTFGRPTTVMYPLERREPPPTYRGMNAVIWDLCIGCGICGEVCPNRCLKMKPVELSDDEDLDPATLAAMRDAYAGMSGGNTDDIKKNEKEKSFIE